MNAIKYFVFLVVVLFAAPLQAEFYKYVDEEGNVYFTDDLNRVPEDQRVEAVALAGSEDDLDADAPEIEDQQEEGYTETDFESENDTDNDFVDESGEEPEDFSKDVTDQDDTDNWVDAQEDEPEQTDLAGEEELGSEGDDTGLSEETGKEDDLDNTRKRLEALKTEIDNEYRALVKQKEELAKQKEKLKTREEILNYNKMVEELNKRADAYTQKGKDYQAQVEAYNARIAKENARITENKQTE